MLDLATATSVATGTDHSCAIDSAGTVWCWGSNRLGQLGDGSGVSSSRPLRVVDLEPAVSIAAGSYFTCATTSVGAARCWGENSSGQLGDGIEPPHATPRQSLIYCR